SLPVGSGSNEVPLDRQSLCAAGDPAAVDVNAIEVARDEIAGAFLRAADQAVAIVLHANALLRVSANAGAGRVRADVVALHHRAGRRGNQNVLIRIERDDVSLTCRRSANAVPLAVRHGHAPSIAQRGLAVGGHANVVAGDAVAVGLETADGDPD